MNPKGLPVAVRYVSSYGGSEVMLPQVVRDLETRGCEVETIAVDASDPPPVGQGHETVARILRQKQLVVALGGDGTILSTARLLAGSQIPILGLNLKGLGFLTAVRSVNYQRAFDALFAGEMRMERRQMLKVTYTTPTSGAGQREHPWPALNDVAVVRGVPTTMIQLEIRLDGELLTALEADGIILASPTGSTAYNLAGGGPIIWPELEVMTLTPIMPHSLTVRPVVIPITTLVEVQGGPQSRGQILLAIDGQYVELGPTPKITITRSEQSTLLARMDDTHFGVLLRRKLYWGGRLRGVEEPLTGD